MRVEDVPDVSRVERECFPNPWPQSAYRRELRNPSNNYYVVLRRRAERTPTRPARGDAKGPLALLPFVRRTEPAATTADPIVGFAGMWMLFDEAHVTTIGVTPEQRGKGLGELMLVDLFEHAMARNAEWVTLEVRVSNASAQALYQKYGFTRQGVRRRYYSDNGEDAYIMWSPSIRSAEFRAKFAELKQAIEARLGDELITAADAHGGSASANGNRTRDAGEVAL
jgi:ribosomal-protein-alanine N-acetyltransferase